MATKNELGDVAGLCLTGRAFSAERVGNRTGAGKPIIRIQKLNKLLQQKSIEQPETFARKSTRLELVTLLFAWSASLVGVYIGTARMDGLISISLK